MRMSDENLRAYAHETYSARLMMMGVTTPIMYILWNATNASHDVILRDKTKVVFHADGTITM